MLDLARTARLEGKRLALVPFEERHLTPTYVSWINDPAVVRFSEQRHRSHTLSSCEAYMRSFEGTAHHFWAIEVHEDGLGHVGNMNAYVDPPNRVADVGIMIGDVRARSRGLGLEAWRMACDHLLGPGGMRKVTAGTLSTNEPMLAIMARAGMKPDGTRSRQMLWEGREIDIVHAALFRDEG